MTKASLVELVAESTGVSKRKAGQLVDRLAYRFTAELMMEGRAVLPGVGVFNLKYRAPRKARNIHTGEPITVPAGRRVKFLAAKPLRNQVNAIV